MGSPGAACSGPAPGGLTLTSRESSGTFVLRGSSKVPDVERIGVRELRQHASKWLQRVAAGEGFIVTVRGRPVAKLVPVEEELTGLAGLIASGRAVVGKGDVLDFPMLPARPGEMTLSEALEELRRDER